MSNVSSGRWLAVAVAGPVVQGTILGLRQGPGATLALALGLPAVVGAVTLLTTPTLYVGGALVGGRLSLGAVAASTGRALHALGLAMLGLAPLSLLLATTSAGRNGLWAQVLLLVGVAMMVALHRLASELDAASGDHPRGPAWYLLFAFHTAIAFIIGARLFDDVIVFSERLGS
jgi:hypothetical protein